MLVGDYYKPPASSTTASWYDEQLARAMQLRIPTLLRRSSRDRERRHDRSIEIDTSARLQVALGNESKKEMLEAPETPLQRARRVLTEGERIESLCCRQINSVQVL